MSYKIYLLFGYTTPYLPLMSYSFVIETYGHEVKLALDLVFNVSACREKALQSGLGTESGLGVWVTGLLWPIPVFLLVKHPSGVPDKGRLPSIHTNAKRQGTRVGFLLKADLLVPLELLFYWNFRPPVKSAE